MSGDAIRLSGAIGFPVPPERSERYRPHLASECLLFGMRPKHITEQHPTASRISTSSRSRSN